jgi:5'-3' exonuclease
LPTLHGLGLRVCTASGCGLLCGRPSRAGAFPGAGRAPPSPIGHDERHAASARDTLVKVHLVDGTYELFRHFFAVPSHVTAGGEEIGATRGVLGSVLGLLGDATHVGVATDHVIESWRNDRWPTYKTGAGVDPVLKAQFPLLEDALGALGVVVWPMVEWEADDALGSAAKVAAADPAVEQVIICTPDKDLGQCVTGTRVVQLDRRKRQVLDADGVRAKFGVAPASIPDYLALVGDSADGFPGLPGWGAKSAAAVLARYETIEAIPPLGHQWSVDVRNARTLAATLAEHRELALLFKELATLVTEPPVIGSVEELRWTGPTDEFAAMCARLDAPEMVERAERLASR